MPCEQVRLACRSGLVGVSRLAYYKVQADSGFWDQHWRAAISPELYDDAKRSGLAYYEVPFTRYLPRDGKILEAGCGTGYYVAALRARGYDIEGVDFAADTIIAIRQACPGLPVTVADVTKLSVEDGYYKAYISLGVMEHRQEGPEPFLSEAYRVLCPGGVALISLPWMHTLRRCKAALGLYRGNPDGLSFYQYAYDDREMKALIMAAGFEVIELYPYDGYKGLKDEIPALRHMLTWPRVGWRAERFLRSAKWLDPAFAHMMLYVCRRPGH